MQNAKPKVHHLPRSNVERNPASFLSPGCSVNSINGNVEALFVVDTDTAGKDILETLVERLMRDFNKTYKASPQAKLVPFFDLEMWTHIEWSESKSSLVVAMILPNVPPSQIKSLYGAVKRATKTEITARLRERRRERLSNSVRGVVQRFLR